MNTKFAARLKTANKNWKKATARAKESSGFDEVEDGRYVARLTECEIGEAKSSGRLQVIWKYKIAEGDYKGTTKFSFDGLETEDNLMFLARTLTRYGYEMPEDIVDIEQILKDLTKAQPLVRVRLKTRGEFQNVYIDNVFDKEDEDEVLADARSEAGAADDADEADETDETDAEETDDEEVETEDEDDDAGDDDADEASEDEEDADEEEADEEEADEEVALEAGLRVIVPHNGKKVKAVVVEVLEKEEKVRVKTDAGKVIRVPIDALEADEAEAEEEDEDSDIPAAPVKPAKGKDAKKAAPAPAKKKR